MYNQGISTVSASTARQTLPSLLDRVGRGEEIEIARHGRVVAVLVSPDALASRRAHRAWEEANELRDLLEAARQQPVRRSALGPGRADELVADARHGRDAR